MAEFTTMEIAFRTRKSERQVQRWIKSGKLKAQHIDGPLYEVNEDDLTPFLPREVVHDLVERIGALERRIQELEAKVAEITPHTPAIQKPSPRPPREHERTSINPLPDGWASIADLINEHDLPRSTVIRQMEKWIHTGEWTRAGHAVSKALDPEGIAEFERRYVHDS